MTKSTSGDGESLSYTKHFVERGGVAAPLALGVFAIIGVLILGGPITYMLQAMVQYPEWQRKCQDEIDALGGRMPELRDVARLPILRACIKETMRWRPTVPTGAPHEVERDDWDKDYFIPKGSRMIPLEW